MLPRNSPNGGFNPDLPDPNKPEDVPNEFSNSDGDDDFDDRYIHLSISYS